MVLSLHWVQLSFLHHQIVVQLAVLAEVVLALLVLAPLVLAVVVLALVVLLLNHKCYKNLRYEIIF